MKLTDHTMVEFVIIVGSILGIGILENKLLVIDLEILSIWYAILN